MDKFTASNGARFAMTPRGGIEFLGGIDDHLMFLGPALTAGMREFFQAERDEELGRWRSKQFPEFVAYWHPVLQKLTVIWEPQGGSTEFKRDDVPPPGSGGLPAEAARDYFEAHPERKPWHDAKPGEVWGITDHMGQEHAMRVTVGGDFTFIDGHATYATDCIAFTDGRRIWPEDAP